MKLMEIKRTQLSNNSSYTNNKYSIQQHNLKRESVNYKIIRVLKGHQGEAAYHLVLQLRERDAIMLLAQKICFSFNRRMVNGYVSIQRCYKCQLRRTTARNCPNEEACANCSDYHNVTDCTKRKYSCAHCRLIVNKHAGVCRKASVHIQHPFTIDNAAPI